MPQLEVDTWALIITIVGGLIAVVRHMTRLETIVTSVAARVDKGFDKNTEDHKEIHVKLDSHGNRISTIEARMTTLINNGSGKSPR